MYLVIQVSTTRQIFKYAWEAQMGLSKYPIQSMQPRFYGPWFDALNEIGVALNPDPLGSIENGNFTAPHVG